MSNEHIFKFLTAGGSIPPITYSDDPNETAIRIAGKPGARAIVAAQGHAPANMDLATLKATHPAVYAAAVAEGVAQERDRVAAHLAMAEASGDMKTAIEAIKKGDGMTALHAAKYKAAQVVALVEQMSGIEAEGG